MTNFDKSEYHINSVSKLLDIATRLIYTSYNEPQKYLYRGEPSYDNKYGLRPGIGRLIDEEPFNGNKERLLKFEEQAFNHFIIKTLNESNFKNDYVLLARAQHHGLKTRLLDWTLNLLTALFFAVDEKKKINEDGSFFSLQLPSNYIFNDFPRDSSPISVKDSDYYFLFTPYVSPRIRAQQGVFQLFTQPLESFTEGYSLMKFRIPANNKKEIKKQLFEMGIHEEFLFTDLDGLCRSINYYSLNS